MNEISEIENRNLSIHQKNQLDKQNSKNNNQKQETDKLFEECTKLFQTNDKWKGSVQKSINEAMTEIQAQEEVIKCKFDSNERLSD